MQIACKTDVGKRRKQNEDSCAVSKSYAIVADGMGGHNKGEIASRMAVDILSECFENAHTCTAEQVTQAIRKANKAIFGKSKTEPECAGMGTTVVAAVWNDKKIVVAHVGDSRCYEIYNGEIRLVTKDHTLVQTLLDEGKISGKEAENYPDKHIITRAVGTDPSESPDVTELAREKDKWLILCSDGLTNHVREDSILACIENNAEPQTVADRLVDMANAGGGLDNITVVAVKF